MTDVRESFVECDGAIDLKGFPRFGVLESLNSGLRSIYKLKESDKRHGGQHYRYLRFDNSRIDERQEVMKRLERESGNSVVSTFRDTAGLRSGLPGDYRDDRITVDQFDSICKKYKELYDLSEGFLSRCNVFLDDVSYKELMEEYPKTLIKFDGLVEKIDKLDGVKSFYIDLRKNAVTLVSQDDIPDNLTLPIDLSGEAEGDLFEVRRFGKKKLQRIYDQCKNSQRLNVLKALKKELCAEDSTVEKMYSLSKPFVIDGKYHNYVNNLWIERAFHGFDGVKLADYGFTYPKFSNKFNLKDLFPLTAYDGWEDKVTRIHPGELVNIDFNTKRSKSKNLFVGLNSGGKSFFLEALATTIMVANAGLPIPANKAVLPKYNRLVYYNNTGRESFGKLETEMSDVARVIDKAEKDDIIIIDNFFEGGTPQVTTNVSARYMEALTDVPATVLIESHAPLDLEYFESQGWTIFSPGYIENDGKLEPSYVIEEAKPDHDVVTRFAVQMADQHMSKLTKKRLAKRRK
ncbi:MAG: hypothetical protein GOV02_03715 [Candidatus Aenigmarchaeota archaeon]|nr:hypothetical protein [Candidatus Aenigmarchaeota archaeon]